MTALAPHGPRHPINYVFVDYENVPHLDLGFIGEKAVHLTLLLGPRQTKLDVDLVEKLMAHAATVQLVRLESAGKDALDFTLACYLGRALQADPTAYFHILSRDTGYDPLVEHLKHRNVRVARHADVSTLTGAIPLLNPPSEAKNTLYDDVLAHLSKTPSSRPKKVKTLKSSLKAHFGKSMECEAWLEPLLQKLVKTGRIKVGTNEAVQYNL